MSKYSALRDLLRRSGGATVSITLKDLAEAVPGGLPSSAYRHRTWWSNEAIEGRHVQCHEGWAAADYAVVSIDLTKQTVTFRHN